MTPKCGGKQIPSKTEIVYKEIQISQVNGRKKISCRSIQKKCQVLHREKNTRAEFYLLNQKILTTEAEKDLGVIFNSKFHSTINSSKSSKAANRVIGLIRRNIINKSENEMLILY